ncbi:MAG: amidohydrolase family protein [Burkholderiales bacterium]
MTVIASAFCDTHAHVFGPEQRYPYNPARAYTPPDAPLEAWLALHAKLGIGRGVLVQPSVYGTDNRAILDAVALHPGRLRAVVAVGAEVSDAELERLHAAGARGIRVNLADKGGNPFASPADLERTAARIAPLGWHVELLVHVHQLDAWRDVFERLPLDVVVGHLGYMPAELGVAHPAWRAFLEVVRAGRCWVKLSAPYRITARSAMPYDDVAPFARELVAARPDRILWGSDWPHPHIRSKAVSPDDAGMLAQFAQWVPDEALRRRILADNPAKLYGF